MNSRRIRKLMAVSLCSLALVASACGGDDDDDAASATTSAGTSADTAAAGTEAPADTTAAVTEATQATSDATAGGPATTAAANGAEAEAALTELVAAAEEEGSVTIYSSQGLDQLNALAAAFQEKYPGVSVEVVRGTDGDTIPRVDTELATNTSGGDLVVTGCPRMGADPSAGRQLGRSDGQPTAGGSRRLRRRAVFP